MNEDRTRIVAALICRHSESDEAVLLPERQIPIGLAFGFEARWMSRNTVSSAVVIHIQDLSG